MTGIVMNPAGAAVIETLVGGETARALIGDLEI
jgi:hypothetical protein